MVDIGKNMKLLMIEDNTSVSEMMGMFYKKEKWDVAKFFLPVFQTPSLISYC